MVDLRSRIRLSALQKNINLQRRVRSRVRPVELVNCAAIQASASERQIRATGRNLEQEVRLCESKSSGGPDGGNPTPTRQGRWVRLRLGTAPGTAGNVSRPYGTSCITPVGNERAAQQRRSAR